MKNLIDNAEGDEGKLHYNKSADIFDFTVDYNVDIKNITKHYLNQKKKKEQHILLNKIIKNQMMMMITNLHLAIKVLKLKHLNLQRSLNRCMVK